MAERPPFWRNPGVAFVVDALLVLVFAATGRASHDEGITASGVFATASPFLVGTAVGWLLVRALRGSWPLEVGPGITVWFATVFIGMALRVAVLGSLAWAFVAVAAAVLATLLIGWRALLTLATARSARR